MSNNEYIQHIVKLMESLNEKDLRQIYTIAHRKYIRREPQQEDAAK